MKSIIAIILSALLAIVPVMGETAIDDNAVEEMVAETYMIEGIVVQHDENGILVNTGEMGMVLVLSADETLWEGKEVPEAGDYIYVDYNGMMSRSIPAQITAMLVRCHSLEGVVTEVFAEENAMIINTETHGDVYVRLPAEEEETEAEEAVQEAPEAEEAAESEEAETETAAEEAAVSEEAETETAAEEAAESEEAETETAAEEAAGVESVVLPAAGDTVTVYFNGVMTMSLPGQINAGLVVIHPVEAA